MRRWVRLHVDAIALERRDASMYQSLSPAQFYDDTWLIHPLVMSHDGGIWTTGMPDLNGDNPLLWNPYNGVHIVWTSLRMRYRYPGPRLPVRLVVFE